MALELLNPNLYGSFVPTTFLLDVSIINKIDIDSPEFKELLVRLYRNLNRMCLSLNVKTSGYYALNQFVTGDLYFPATAGTSLVNADYRPVTRKVINFGTLPNAGTKSVAHGITINAGVSFVRIYGSSTDPVGFNYIPLPYASPTDANNIELNVDATNVNVITGSDRTAYTLTYIVLEFLTS